MNCVLSHYGTGIERSTGGKRAERLKQPPVPPPRLYSAAHLIADAGTRTRLIATLQTSVGNRRVQRALATSDSDDPGADKSYDAHARDGVAQRIEAASEAGAPLDSAVRPVLERSLHSDLAGVKLHVNPEAGDLALALNAIAFTSGRNIFIRPEAYDLRSRKGMNLLAHEAVHVVQQANGPVAGTPTPDGTLTISDPSDAYEQEATQAADAITSVSDSAADQIMSQEKTHDSSVIAMSPRATLPSPIQRCGQIPCNCPADQKQRVNEGLITTLAVQRRVVCDPENPEACWEEPDDDSVEEQGGFTPAEGGQSYDPETGGMSEAGPEEGGFTPVEGGQCYDPETGGMSKECLEEGGFTPAKGGQSYDPETGGMSEAGPEEGGFTPAEGAQSYDPELGGKSRYTPPTLPMFPPPWDEHPAPSPSMAPYTGPSIGPSSEEDREAWERAKEQQENCESCEHKPPPANEICLRAYGCEFGPIWDEPGHNQTPRVPPPARGLSTETYIPFD